MVYYYKSRCGEYTIYMGKDKYENEHLIKYGLPEDVWLHVDNLSSAHVYIRMKPGMTLEDLGGSDLLMDCASLVKANSIQGCKQSTVYVIYTRWKNLKKTSDMVDGQVGFHRPEVRMMLECRPCPIDGETNPVLECASH
jgi:predicted ribosome quality control (RQC) complex YloA/Tae2 family protein